MDPLSKWYSQMADAKTLLSLWETRNQAGTANTKRCREILTICLFTLCLENHQNKRFLIGFQKYGSPEIGSVTALFKDGFGEIEDTDVILVPDLGPGGPSERDIQRYQLLGYRNRSNPNPYDLASFIEGKKLRYTPRDDALSLIVNIEQDNVPVDPGFIAAYLRGRLPRCPYGHVFLLGQAGADEDRSWLSWQLYPELIRFRDMDIKTARTLLADRKTICEFVPGTPPPEVLTEEWHGKRKKVGTD